MRKKFIPLVVLVALATGVSLFGTPSISQAVTITSVEVMVGSTVWCNIGNVSGACATANHLWNLGTGVTLFPTSQSLVLTQTGGTAGFNFDTSDACITPCLVTPKVIIGGVRADGSVFSDTFIDSTFQLAPNGGTDPNTNAGNEARNWVAATGSDTAFNVNFAYADNLHTGPCADTTATSPTGTTPPQTLGNCLPDNPWTNATVFLGGGTTIPNQFGFPPFGTDAFHCKDMMNGTCFDAGAIQIHDLEPPRVPAPATLLLLGTGFLGLAAYGRKHLKKSA